MKPVNILIESGGHLKLTDFGAARLSDAEDGSRTRGTMIGTIGYMSPEQITGQPVDARTDLFATGVVLYQMLTGTRPFDGNTDFQIIQHVVNADPVRVTSVNPSLPKGIDAILGRALAKNKSQRFPSAAELLAGLEEVAIPRKFRQMRKGEPGAFKAPRTVAAAAPEKPGKHDTGSLPPLHNMPGVLGQIELNYWQEIKDSTDPADFVEFLEKFHEGIYERLARRKITKLSAARMEDTAGSVEVQRARDSGCGACPTVAIRHRAGRSTASRSLAVPVGTRA